MRIVIACTLGLLAWAGTAQAQTAKDLWPDAQGNAWTYELRGNLSSGQTQEIKVSQRSGGWARFEGFEGAHWLWLSGQSGRIWVWDAQAGDYQQAFDLGGAVNSRFTMRFPGAACLDRSEWEVVDRAASVQTPAGTFQDCVVIRNVRPVCADAGIEVMTFAPGVGLVRYGWTTIAGPQEALLIHAVVDGRVIQPQPAFAGGLEATLATDRYTYHLTENRMPGPGLPPGGRPRRPDTLQARLTVTNGTAEAVPFTFNSTQNYDFVIRDAAGQQVWTWSANKRFGRVVQTLRLQPGETWTFEESIELRDLNGQPLPAGDYTLEAIHKGGPLETRVVGRFKIELQVVY